MASRNADSMTNAQGEFQPSKPRSEPIESSGHQVGRQVGNDAAPEFHAKVLPAGTAPTSRTFKPNAESETPGQADNELAGRLHGKENTRTDALDMPGATSGDVHTGLGHPGSGQTSTEKKHEGAHTSTKSGQTGGVTGLTTGGSGLRDEGSHEARRLQTEHKSGPASEQQHNVSLDGAESKEPQNADQVASEGNSVKQGDYDRSAEKPPGKNS